jgi:hypothetical protein
MTRDRRSAYIGLLAGGLTAMTGVSTIALAYEPAPPDEKPRPEITRLKISPSSFYSAPTEATVSKARTKAKRRYGTTISYYDSQAATTLLGLPGRDGCQKQSKGVVSYTACYPISSTFGSFFHSDKAGLNTVRFSGWIGRTAHGRKKRLAPGTYRLVVLPRNAAGSGQQVSAEFTIKR